MIESIDSNHDKVVSGRELKSWLFPVYKFDLKQLNKLKKIITSKYLSIVDFYEDLKE